MPKNPFGMRNNEIIVISDLTREERGLKCNCLCPQCGGKLEAKMGNIKVYHFSHTKDACDETLLFIKGIFMLIELMIRNEKNFYAPPLIVTYKIPPAHISITMDNVEEYIQIKHKINSLNDYKCLEGKRFNVDKIELKVNSKNHAEALILTSLNNHQLAIRILPPPNVCKSEKILPYENFSTLICDARDINFNKDKKEKIIDKLKDINRWHWLKNQRIKEFYNKIIENINRKQQELKNTKVNIKNEFPYLKDKHENKSKFRECDICGKMKNTSEFGASIFKCNACLNKIRKQNEQEI
jgi:hypothetical protein